MKKIKVDVLSLVMFLIIGVVLVGLSCDLIKEFYNSSAKNEIIQSIEELKKGEIKEIKSTKEGKTNKVEKVGDKIVITQDIEGVNYKIVVNDNDAILMYLTGYNAFNTNLKNNIIEYN